MRAAVHDRRCDAHTRFRSRLAALNAEPAGRALRGCLWLVGALCAIALLVLAIQVIAEVSGTDVGLAAALSDNLVEAVALLVGVVLTLALAAVATSQARHAVTPSAEISGPNRQTVNTGRQLPTPGSVRHTAGPGDEADPAAPAKPIVDAVPETAASPQTFVTESSDADIGAAGMGGVVLRGDFRYANFRITTGLAANLQVDRGPAKEDAPQAELSGPARGQEELGRLAEDLVDHRLPGINRLIDRFSLRRATAELEELERLVLPTAPPQCLFRLYAAWARLRRAQHDNDGALEMCERALQYEAPCPQQRDLLRIMVLRLQGREAEAHLLAADVMRGEP